MNSADIEIRIDAIERERATLLEQLREAKRAERVAGTFVDLDTRDYPDTADKRVALFHGMFAARRDVYPRFWENERTARKGYSPVMDAVWKDGKRLNATEVFAKYGPSKFYPLNAAVIETHLRGKQTVGTYAIRADDTCIFLAADFDDDGWREEVTAYRDEAAKLGVPALVEISRSGNGAHAWIFFAEPVAAARARLLGSLILARVTARHPGASLRAYDRFFPNQDSMPKGGFGNLIALPLQKDRRAHGLTEFVDRDFNPYEDQWKILSEVARISAEELETILSEHLPVSGEEDRESIETEEWILESSASQTVELPTLCDREAHLAETLTVPTEGLSAASVARIARLATIPNPVFFEKQRQRFPTYNIPRHIFAGELHDDHVVLPRSCTEDTVDLFAECGARLAIVDRRLKPRKLPIKFQGELTRIQKQAVDAMKNHEHGVLTAPPGAGKTVMACALIARRKTPTLILVHRQALLDQWKERLTQFLSIDEQDIGQIRSGKRKPCGKVDLVMIQTLSNAESLKRFFRDYGLVIVDECHHVPAVTVERVLKECGSRYLIGLTATPKRKDRLEKLLCFQCGPIRHVVPDAAPEGVKRQVYVRPTSFIAEADAGGPVPLHVLWQRLIESKHRNELIARDILAATSDGRAPIVLSDRKEHLEKLMEAVAASPSGEPELVYIDGQLAKGKRKTRIERYLAAIREKRPACLFSTASLLGEGFDFPELDTLILAMPISFRGRIVQYAGRLNRPHPGKAELRVYDYLDQNLTVALSMYRKRATGYRELGYIITHTEE